MTDGPIQALPAAPEHPTGPLDGTAAMPAASRAPLERAATRGLFLRLGELLALLIAVVGAVALGLGITDYFRQHTYIAAYLLAYAGFRIADVLVREDYGPNPFSDALGRRMADQLPLIFLFAAAPFERTYFYGGDPAKWMGTLALLIELSGLWLALGARIQLAFFSVPVESGAQRKLVRNGFYRYVRHPVFAGVFIALLAWPIAYGAPITLLILLIAGLVILRANIAAEERELLVRYGDDYASYQRQTDALIPNLW